jgi:hypothetical protein
MNRSGAPTRAARVSSASPGRPQRAATWLLRVAADNAHGAVYGTVMVGVLLAAEDTHHEGYPETIAAATLVLALYWLMSLYTYTLGIRLRTGGRLDRPLLRRSSTHELALVEGALIPILAVLVAWAAGATLDSGVTVALWVTSASIVALELAAAWRAQLAPRDRWIQAGVGAVMGLAIIALKLVLH